MIGFIKIIKRVFAVLMVVTVVLSAQTDLPQRGICGHRGARSTFPENTIPAFKEALRLGVHMIEFDVWLSKDNRLIVMHDPSVDRTTNGKGLISDLTFDEIKSFDAGAWKSEEFSGVQVPTFEEVMEIMPYNIWLNIHIKKIPEAAKRVAEIIVSKNRIHQSMMAVNKEMMSIVKEVSNEIKICNMDRVDSPEQYVDETIAMGCEFIQLTDRADASLPILVKKLKENNVKINYYGTNSSVKLEQLLSAGVDYVLVDSTSQMLNAAGELGIISVDYKLDE
ncbi:MAG: hypothetical protein A2V66_14665 [Ignavibacteria bacterium RBG_13_36_8]|nr:MAG: hypothetical protein A2V66_14665 [Ignavibacteria bacterium RBG_13_36_8]